MLTLGIDVSKSKLDCSLLLDANELIRKTKSVSNSKIGVINLLSWCDDKHAIKPQQLHAIIEGTGIYHQRIALVLFDAGVKVSIVNPAFMPSGAS